MSDHLRIGVDLGGTKIEGVALAPDGTVRARQRVATPHDYATLLDVLPALVRSLEAGGERRASVGIGIPGTVVATTGLVKNANTTWLNGEPLGRDLETRLDRPIRLMNDANCFALSEATDGAAAGAHAVFGVILGTGVGGGIVIDGRCHEGVNQIGGEWGHNPLPWMTPDEYPGATCFCGRRGCVETFLAGPWVQRDHERVTGRAHTTREIVAAAGEGDADATATMARYDDRLARALASVVNLLDPDVIVLGGGMSNLPGLAERAQAALPQYVFSDTVVTRVVRNLHGDSSGVRGAAWLWPARTP